MNEQIGTEYVQWTPDKNAEMEIEQSIQNNQSVIILGDSDNVEEILSRIASKCSYNCIFVSNLAACSLADDGGFTIPARYDPTGEYSGKTLFPEWAIEILHSPEKHFLLCLDYIDYANMKSLEWLRSVLNHSICGKKIENYLVCAHALTGNPSQTDYDALIRCFDTVISGKE